MFIHEKAQILVCAFLLVTNRIVSDFNFFILTDALPVILQNSLSYLFASRCSVWK